MMVKQNCYDLQTQVQIDQSNVDSDNTALAEASAGLYATLGAAIAESIISGGVGSVPGAIASLGVVVAWLIAYNAANSAGNALSMARAALQPCQSPPSSGGSW